MSSLRVVRWKGDQILARVPRILNEYGPLIGFQLQQEISKPQFEYTDDEGRDVITRRKSGRVVGSPRDIVDTGELLNSQSAPEVQGSTLTIRWTAPYSRQVLEGGYVVGTLRNNYVAKPRDWITPALRNRPFVAFFVKRWGELAGRA